MGATPPSPAPVETTEEVPSRASPSSPPATLDLSQQGATDQDQDHDHVDSPKHDGDDEEDTFPPNSPSGKPTTSAEKEGSPQAPSVEDKSPAKEKRRSTGIRNCEQCRTRKQKCDRLKPCSNCTLRGLDCKYGPGSDIIVGLTSIEKNHAEIARLRRQVNTLAKKLGLTSGELSTLSAAAKRLVESELRREEAMSMGFHGGGPSSTPFQQSVPTYHSPYQPPYDQRYQPTYGRPAVVPPYPQQQYPEQQYPQQYSQPSYPPQQYPPRSYQRHPPPPPAPHSQPASQGGYTTVYLPSGEPVSVPIQSLSSGPPRRLSQVGPAPPPRAPRIASGPPTADPRLARRTPPLPSPRESNKSSAQSASLSASSSSGTVATPLATLNHPFAVMAIPPRSSFVGGKGEKGEKGEETKEKAFDGEEGEEKEEQEVEEEEKVEEGGKKRKRAGTL